MALTSRCPENKTEVHEASKRIGCGVDDYGNIQYMCMPNMEKSSLVEFCFNDAMGIEEKGKQNGITKRNNTTIYLNKFCLGKHQCLPEKLSKYAPVFSL